MGPRIGDKPKGVVEKRPFFRQTRFEAERGLIGRAVVSRAAAIRDGGDAPSAQSGECGRIQAAAHAAGIGARIP